jgi:thiol-disulfide isomerase/thioredoxin
LFIIEGILFTNDFRVYSKGKRRLKNMKIRSYIAVFCLLALVVSTMFITSCVKKKDAKEETPAVEKSEAQESAAPQDTAKGPTYKNLVDGEDISLENLKGHVLIIDFWTTWCGPCRMEIPGFIELYDKYKDQKVTIVGISLDRGG